MRIGITERGDAGIDLSWSKKLNKVDGCVLITKNITNLFIDKIFNSGRIDNLIVHCTCTGYGGTILEPNVPQFRKQIKQLKLLIDCGFPEQRTVLRVDPIIPTQKGLEVAKGVFMYFYKLFPEYKGSFRISVINEYRHVKRRYKRAGIQPAYTGFIASDEQLRACLAMLKEVYAVFNKPFNLCAEPDLFAINDYSTRLPLCESGCISPGDIIAMGIEEPINRNINPQNRFGCQCLSCKTELLTNRKRCPNGCLYCYWKD